ncbi:hypothetical protein RRG08_014060 [Elysia crispata]|uniref:Uncharacterized protein n=1 Tax=Elysia crispata TaxID=231223 RepID=A0AAE0ZZA1_9GAST|nr:hypothetical protein RRG08_014060 [Elysia crispata]
MYCGIRQALSPVRPCSRAIHREPCRLGTDLRSLKDPVSRNFGGAHSLSLVRTIGERRLKSRSSKGPGPRVPQLRPMVSYGRGQLGHSRTPGRRHGLRRVIGRSVTREATGSLHGDPDLGGLGWNV